MKFIGDYLYFKLISLLVKFIILCDDVFAKYFLFMEVMLLLQLQITGQIAEVQAFVHYLEEQPYFAVEEKEEEKGYDYFSLACDVKTSLLKPSLRTFHELHIVTADQQKVVLALLDAKVEKEGDKTIVSGLGYDIFA
jgi:hypothetical protein